MTWEADKRCLCWIHMKLNPTMISSRKNICLKMIDINCKTNDINKSYCLPIFSLSGGSQLGKISSDNSYLKNAFFAGR